MAGIAELLPAAGRRRRRPGRPGRSSRSSAAPSGEKIAYVRMFSGTIRTRDRLRFGRELEGKVTAIAVFERGPAVQRPSVAGGRDREALGARARSRSATGSATAGRAAHAHQFPPPTLESVVVAARSAPTAQRLRVALAQLAEQDPLINVRQDDDAAGALGLALRRGPEGGHPGDAGERLRPRRHVPRDDADLHRAARRHRRGRRGPPRGDRIRSSPRSGCASSRRPHGSGIEFRLEVDLRTVPLYIYKTLESFTEHMDEYVREALREGLFGWQVTDCVVTMTKCAYSVPDGPPSRRGPLSTAADFRKLTPLVLMQALERAGHGGLRADRPRQPRDPDGHDRRGHGRAGAARRRRRDAVAARASSRRSRRSCPRRGRTTSSGSCRA